jgi:hypothetical protein
LQNDLALTHAVAIKLKHPLKPALIDQFAEAETCQLRCGKIVPRAFCQPNCGIPDYMIQDKSGSTAFNFAGTA